MNNDQPKRLMNDQFISSGYSFRLYKQRLAEYHRLHWHEFYELCFVMSGQGMNIVNGVPQTLERGHLFLLTPADFHEIYPTGDEPLDIYNVVFSEEMLDEPIRMLLFHDFKRQTAVAVEEDYPQILREYEKIALESAHLLPGGFRIAKGALEYILIYLSRNNLNKTGEPPHGWSLQSVHPGVLKALIHIHHFFREPLSLTAVSRQAQLAPNYFSECFRKATGVSFQNYLQEMRLKFARALLLASDLPVTEICHVSGFNTLTHFERVFKQKYEVTPRQIKKDTTMLPEKKFP